MQMNIWNIIYLNCGERCEGIGDHPRYIHNCEICVIYTFVKSNSWPLWYRCSAIFYHLRVKELTKWANPSWLDSSVDRALHWYRRGHAFEFRLDLNCITAMINYAFAIFTYSHIRYFWLANTPSGKSLIRFEFRYLWKQCMYSKSLN